MRRPRPDEEGLHGELRPSGSSARDRPTTTRRCSTSRAESLTAAQELWREENDADQEQVKYWQNLVKQASDTNNKREVKQSDAMYYEIGSYLSEARSLYLKGDSS